MKQRNWTILLYFSTIENQNKIKNSVLFFYKVNLKKQNKKTPNYSVHNVISL